MVPSLPGQWIWRLNWERYSDQHACWHVSFFVEVRLPCQSDVWNLPGSVTKPCSSQRPPTAPCHGCCSSFLHHGGIGSGRQLGGVGRIIVWYPACLYSQVLMPAAIQQFSTSIQRFLIRNPDFGQHSYIHSQYSIFQIHSKL